MMKKILSVIIICLFGVAVQETSAQQLLELTRSNFSETEIKRVEKDIERLLSDAYSSESGDFQKLYSASVDTLLTRFLFHSSNILKITLQEDALVTVVFGQDFEPEGGITSLYNEIYALLFKNDHIAAVRLIFFDGGNCTFLPFESREKPTRPIENALMKKEWFFYYADYVSLFGKKELAEGVYYNENKEFATHKIDSVLKPYKEYQTALERWDTEQIKAFLEAGADPEKIFLALNKGLINYAADNGDWKMYQLMERYRAVAYHAHNKDGYGTYFAKKLLMSAIDGGNPHILNEVVRIVHMPTEEVRKILGSKLVDNVKKNRFEMLKRMLYWGANIESIDANYMTALMAATENGNIEIMEYLLFKGASMKVPYNYRAYTLLSLAVKSGNWEAVELILNRGADVNEYSTQVTAVYVAAENGYLDIVQLLVERGADINFRSRGYGMDGRKSGTPLGIALTNKHYDVVDYLLKNGAVHSSEIGDASIKGHIEGIRLLLEHGARVDNPSSYLQEAVAYCQPRSVAFWLDYGAEQKSNDYRYFGRTLLMEAAMTGCFESVRLLVEYGADIHATDYRKATPLMYAAATGNVEMIEYLLSKGADLNKVDALNCTLLHYAAKGGGYEAIPFLLSKGLAVDARDKYKRTPLMLSVEYVCNEMYDDGISVKAAPTVKTLIAHGANVNAGDFEGMTPLMFAVRGYYADAIKALINAGANLKAKNKYGDTAAMFYHPGDTYFYDNPELPGEVSGEVEKLLGLDFSQLGEHDDERWATHVKIPYQYTKDENLIKAIHENDIPGIRAALDKGADIFYFNDAASPMADALTIGCSVAVLRLLIENGGWINAINYYGTTSLMRAVMGNDHAAVEYFIRQGADVNQKNDYGNTALIFAAKNGDVPMIKLLISHGADMNVVGNYTTPLSTARNEDRQEAVEYLESIGAKDYDDIKGAS